MQTTHYPRHAKFVSSSTLFIKDGEILAFGRSEQLINAENIDKIYGINYERYEDRYKFYGRVAPLNLAELE